MPTLTALSLTPSARDWLATTTTARVLNIFDRACNLINQDEAILALVTSERGLNPFSMVVASEDQTPFRDLSAASAVSVEAHRLFIGPLHINVASARVWNPMPDWPPLRRMFAADPARLAGLAAIVTELANGGNLLDLFGPHPSPPPHSGGEWCEAPGRGIERALLARARRGAGELVRGLRAGSTEECVAGGRALAGLGGGLTPAGDDFIVGAMLAAWAGLYGAGREPLGMSLVEAAAPLTTTLSAAYLRAAARGECMAHWHTLFGALLQSDVQGTRVAIQSLMSIGHTSGADALAGFLAAHYVTHDITG